MARFFDNWLKAYVQYASYSEAPKKMHFWAGVSAIAGALRRTVWLDMGYFRWYPNFYIILVAPPGIVSKSTTASIAMQLLRKVPGVKFGPDVVTWQALVTAFSESREDVHYDCLDGYVPMCALTLESSELGNLLNPHDREQLDFYVSMWDGKEGVFDKRTKHSGNDVVINPWINIIACTTPSWLAQNFSEYVIGGGFTSRVIFIYTEKKEKLVAYPHLSIPKDTEMVREQLITDLEDMTISLRGPFELTPDALAFGEKWYVQHYTSKHVGLEDDRYGGYLARKQTHIHKLAMVLSASEGNSMQITSKHLQLASEMVTDLEKDMPSVFNKVGRTDVSNNAERIVKWLAVQEKPPTLAATYKLFFHHFPNGREFGELLKGLIDSGQVVQLGVGAEAVLKFVGDAII